MYDDEIKIDDDYEVDDSLSFTVPVQTPAKFKRKNNTDSPNSRTPSQYRNIESRVNSKRNTDSSKVHFLIHHMFQQ